MTPKEFQAIKTAVETHMAARGIKSEDMEPQQLWWEMDAMVAAIAAYKLAMADEPKGEGRAA